MIEAGLVVTDQGPTHWHLPHGRSSVAIPDSRILWDVLWEHRRSEYLAFAHTHPGHGIPSPSHEDLTSFAAIELGLGRRLLWWIVSADEWIALWRDENDDVYCPILVSATGIVPAPTWMNDLRRHSSMEGTKP